LLEFIDPDPCRAAGSVLPGIVIGLALKQTLAVELGECVASDLPDHRLFAKSSLSRLLLSSAFVSCAYLDGGALVALSQVARPLARLRWTTDRSMRQLG
jgi:hypothetical protein